MATNHKSRRWDTQRFSHVNIMTRVSEISWGRTHFPHGSALRSVTVERSCARWQVPVCVWGWIGTHQSDTKQLYIPNVLFHLCSEKTSILSVWNIQEFLGTLLSLPTGLICCVLVLLHRISEQNHTLLFSCKWDNEMIFPLFQNSSHISLTDGPSRASVQVMSLPW